MTIKGIPPQFDRAPKQNELVRCCWVCGKPGGLGFTSALRGAGYRLAKYEMGYTHEKCMRKAMERAAKIQRGE